MSIKNEIKTLKIAELMGYSDKEYSFLVPEYQRGYRWETSHIAALLNDIYNFQNNNDDDSYYCLQPVVVKQREDGQYELIDGQQRLTTIFLIAKALFPANYDWKIYNLEYNHRKNTQNNLKMIVSDQNFQKSFEEIETDSDIDSYYIKNACKVIKKWIDEKKKNDSAFMNNGFVSTFLNKTRIIWYEVRENELPVAVFKRLNKGKIPLDDTELIKALFLKNTKEQKSDTERKNEQFILASQWDIIERELQNDNFWYFLSNNKENKNNRIELILDVLSGKNEVETEEHQTFKFFEKISDKSFNEKQKIWQIIMDYFYLFKGWYEDRELYHLIGYLIAINTKLHEIYNLIRPNNFIDINELLQNNIQSFNKITRQDFINDLKNLIEQKVINPVKNEIENGIYNYNDSKQIRNVLLLHNVYTILNNRNSAAYNFPFDKYKKESWDIEHISPVTPGDDKNFSSAKERINWYKNNIGNKDIGEELNKTDILSEFKQLWENIKNYNKGKTEDNWSFKDDASDINYEKQFDELYKRVINIFNESFKENNNQINDETNKNRLQNTIANLVLLDSATNREYKNALFPIKRHTIINYDKKSKFVPLCTKNAILKYYGGDKEFLVWSKDNAEAYLMDIEAVTGIKQTKGNNNDGNI